MGPQERIFKKTYGKELLTIAIGDLESAKALFLVKKGRLENILFHVEQAVEKSLKAVLCWRQKAVPLTHDIGLLLTKFENNEQLPGGSALTDLTPFATIRRYEEGIYELSDLDITNALKVATDLLVWAEAQIRV